MIASEIMTPNPRTVRANASIRTALELLWSNDVRHLPVLDEEDELVGMLSDRDVGTVVQTFDGGLDALGPRKVGDFMSGGVISVTVETDLVEVIETLLEQRIGAVPVLDGEGELAGIISYVDVLRSYIDELAPAKPAKPVKTKAKPAKAKAKAKPAKAKAKAKPARRR